MDNNMRLQLNDLDSSWENIREIVPYGCGLEAYRTLNRIVKDFKVPFIVDNDTKKQGKLFRDKCIVSPEFLQERKVGRKVLVTIAKRRYPEISRYLESLGLVKNVDFCHISQFCLEWYYKYRGERCIFTMDIPVTTACTLNCKNCNMFIPYHKKKPIVRGFEELKQDVDLLFENIDYVFAMGILGGEAFLNPDLGAFLEYLSTNYKNKIGSILITTNGVVAPKEEILCKLKENDILVTISDYRATIQERSSIEYVDDLLKSHGIYSNIRGDLVWCDFGFPEEPLDLDNAEAAYHMKQCDPGWRGLADGKFYFCNCAWSAEKAGLISLEEEDYIDLNRITNRDVLLKYTISGPQRGYMSICKYCGGCGEDNVNYVEAGRQI